MIAQYYTGSAWKNIEKEIYSYSLEGCLIQITISDWEEDEFEDSARFIFSNNPNGQHLRMDSEIWIGDQWISTPIFDEVPKFHYEEFDENGAIITLSDKVERLRIAICPNLTSDFINLKLKNQNIKHITVIGVKGKVVFETNSVYNSVSGKQTTKHFR